MVINCIDDVNHYSTKTLGIICTSFPPVESVIKTYGPGCDKPCIEYSDGLRLFYQQMLYLNNSVTQASDTPAIKYVAEFFVALCPTKEFAPLNSQGQDFVSALPEVFSSTFMTSAIEASGCTL